MEDRREARSFEMLGRAIRVLRTERGMNRKELAEATGVSYPYLTEIEAGKKSPSSSVISQIADVFEVEPHQLLARADALAAGDRPWRSDRIDDTVRYMATDPMEMTSAPALPDVSRAVADVAFETRPRSSRRETKEAKLLRSRLSEVSRDLEPDDLKRLIDLAMRMVR